MNDVRLRFVILSIARIHLNYAGMHSQPRLLGAAARMAAHGYGYAKGFDL
jgi:hypothetical protein